MPSAPSTVAGLNFVGFDVETANDDWGSICQIGLVKYVDGVEESSESWLCTPPESLNFFNEINIGIHGITPEMVADQPRFADLVPKMMEFVGDLPLVDTKRAESGRGARFTRAFRTPHQV